MNLKTAFAFLILCGVGLNASKECTKKLQGDSYTIEFNSPAIQQQGDSLDWKCNDKPIYQRRREKITATADVDKKGSLILKNLTISMTGTYKAFHYNADGKEINSAQRELCVIAKAPVPKLTVVCSSAPKPSATLKCEPTNNKDFKLSWIRNNKDTTESSNPLHLQRNNEGDRYKCRLINDQLNQDQTESTEVTISCGGSGDLLFGYNKWVMLGIIGAGGFLLLVLIMLLIVICCKNHRRRKRRQRDEEELRLANLQYIGTTPRRPKQTARGQPVPPTPDDGYLQGPEGKPSPADIQQRRQPRPRAPPPPMEDEDEVIPPLPQPRRKGPRHQNT